MSAVDSHFYKKKKGSTFYIGLGFLIFTILGTGALYLFKSSIDTENAALDEEIKKFEDSITETQADKNVQVYSIYKEHQVLLDTLAKRSEIPLFVSHLQKNFQKYGLEGNGFDYNDGVVSVDIESKTGKTKYAYQRIVTMLREYPLDEKALFELEDVTSYKGHDEISYKAKFRLK